MPVPFPFSPKHFVLALLQSKANSQDTSGETSLITLSSEMASLDSVIVPGLEDKDKEREAWNEIVRALQGLQLEAQKRVLKSVTTFLQVELDTTSTVNIPWPVAPSSPQASYSEERTLSAKDFIHEKQPITDIDRVVCLAYYLTHYRNTPHYKTLDISKLNTEAAQIKFSNAAKAVDNAARAGLLVPATKGNKQISSLGELYVQSLPDKAAAREAIDNYRNKRRIKRSYQTSKASSEESNA